MKFKAIYYSQLQAILSCEVFTCHIMGSHSVTCHPTEVNPQSQFKVHTRSTDWTTEGAQLHILSKEVTPQQRAISYRCGATPFTSSMVRRYDTNQHPHILKSRRIAHRPADLSNATHPGTLKPTPTPWLPVLANIAPPSLRRKEATDKLISKISDHSH